MTKWQTFKKRKYTLTMISSLYILLFESFATLSSSLQPNFNWQLKNDQGSKFKIFRLYIYLTVTRISLKLLGVDFFLICPPSSKFIVNHLFVNYSLWLYHSCQNIFCYSTCGWMLQLSQQKYFYKALVH